MCFQFPIFDLSKREIRPPAVNQLEMKLDLTPSNPENNPIILNDVSLDVIPVSNGDAVFITAPFNFNFKEELKRIGAKWSTKRSQWYINANKANDVKIILKKYFGIPDGKRYSFDLLVTPCTSAVELNGRIVVERKGRDSQVYSNSHLNLKEGVLPSSEGSRALPMITRERVVYRVENWPLSPVAENAEILNLEVK